MKKKLEMHLLNDEQLDGVVGGLDNPCTAAGHVLYDGCAFQRYKDNIIKLCMTTEYKCGSGGLNSGFVLILDDKTHEIISGTCKIGTTFTTTTRP